MKSNITKALLFTGIIAMAVNGQTVNQREADQQARIAQGVKSGQLTPGETAKVEAKDAKINRQVTRERAANGGTLKPGEKVRAQRELNRNSAAIAKDKHNAAVQ